MFGEINHLLEKIPVSTIEREGQYQASKWLDVQFLIGPSEMELLLQEIQDLAFFVTSTPTPIAKGFVSHDEFLKVYTDYIASLQNGVPARDGHTRAIFSASATLVESVADTFYRMPIGSDRQLIKLRRPAIQLQSHSFSASPIDGKIRPMVQGTNTISWGLQIAYPQYFQDPHSLEIFRIDSSTSFPNTEPFKRIQRWIRHNTIPTPFVVNGVKQNSPIRIGKEIMPWINSHPDLIQHEVKVEQAK